MCSLWGTEPRKTRKPFSLETKKIEWMRAAGRKAKLDGSGKVIAVKTSKCRQCGRTLKWGDRTYDFDHKDNNSANNSPSNCYLVCKTCHGKHTVVKKRKIVDGWGNVTYKTVKKKVGYKRPTKGRKKKRRVAIRDLFGNVIGYRARRTRKIF